MTTPTSADRRRPALPGDPPARRAWRTTSRMFTSTRASRELAELAAAVQLPLTTGRRIAVVPAHEGAGTSTVAAALAAVYAVRRADPVLAADAAPDDGPLTWRLGVAGGRTMAALAEALPAARGRDLSGFVRLLPRTGTGLWVLPGGAAAQPYLCRDLTRLLSRVFAVCVTDCPQGLGSPATAAVVSEAHAVVLTAAATSDGVDRASRTLADLAAARDASAMARVVVAVNGTGVDGRAAVRAEAVHAAFDRRGVPSVTLPHDRHLTGGGLIVPSLFAEGTTVAATRLAGRALRQARPL